MQICTKCHSEGRIVNVDESSSDSAVITYVCANPRCENYKQEIAQETIKKL